MKALFFICNRYRAHNLRKSKNAKVSSASSIKKRTEQMADCLGVFLCIESGDGLGEARRCVNDIKKACKTSKLKNVLIAPFAHLSHRLANPKKALDLIMNIEACLSAGRHCVLRSSFGFDKSLFLDVKGCNGNIKWRSY